MIDKKEPEKVIPTQKLDMNDVSGQSISLANKVKERS